MTTEPPNSPGRERGGRARDVTGVLVAVTVVGGLLVVSSAALRGGLDVAGVVLFLTTAGVGALALAVSRRARKGTVTPARCDRCGGLVSVHAPYCKHCGARLKRET